MYAKVNKGLDVQHSN